MKLNDYGKLYLLGLGMILGTLMAALLIMRDEPVAGAGIFGSTVGGVIGYLTGNGVLAARTEAPSPVFVPTPEAIATAEMQYEHDQEDHAQ